MSLFLRFSGIEAREGYSLIGKFLPVIARLINLSWKCCTTIEMKEIELEIFNKYIA